MQPVSRNDRPGADSRASYRDAMAREPQGRFLGLPFDWKRPTRQEVGKGVWDPEDRRVFPPKNYGWGYGINFAEIKRRLTGR